jgi:hypothetical protein
MHEMLALPLLFQLRNPPNRGSSIPRVSLKKLLKKEKRFYFSNWMKGA